MSDTGNFHPHRDRQRDLLRRGRLMLLFTPELCLGGKANSLDVLDAVLPLVDVLQIRVKTGARDLFDWSQKALDVLAAHTGLELPVLVNDRVDVALALGAADPASAVAGVHLGQGDLPASAARLLLGDAAIIGRSTHDFAQVVLATEEPIDYLGFGPIFPTKTKGYTQGIGPERAWMADTATHLTIYPIGGIDAQSVSELRPVGRMAVSSAILSADDPEAAARDLRHQISA